MSNPVGCTKTAYHPPRRPGAVLLCLVVALVHAAAAAPAQPKRGRSILLAPGSRKDRPPVDRDPWLPTGALTRPGVTRPPASGEPPACSFLRPVCVHRGAQVAEATAAQALAAVERAYERLVLAMRLPAPLADGGLGGTDGLDLYLEAGTEARLQTGQDPPDLGLFDRASAFCWLEAPERALLDRTATLCVGEAIASRLDAAEGPHLRRSLATQLWFATGTPSSADFSAVDEVQSKPHVSICSRALSRSSEGAAIFLEYLGETFSAAGPSLLETSLLSMAAGATAPDAYQWNNEPRTLKDTTGRRGFHWSS